MLSDAVNDTPVWDTPAHHSLQVHLLLLLLSISATCPCHRCFRQTQLQPPESQRCCSSRRGLIAPCCINTHAVFAPIVSGIQLLLLLPELVLLLQQPWRSSSCHEGHMLCRQAGGKCLQQSLRLLSQAGSDTTCCPCRCCCKHTAALLACLHLCPVRVHDNVTFKTGNIVTFSCQCRILYGLKERRQAQLLLLLRLLLQLLVVLVRLLGSCAAVGVLRQLLHRQAQQPLLQGVADTATPLWHLQQNLHSHINRA
jgi:hypothetical protein